ncbi:hypothetical protein RRG08_027475 [Elysia crispata]|uniref:Uncharacterized protein n=1 Tax=Elysia crispata TaxID=231223 RepID=A0AAE0YR27_9GAST|nr:hypothetical protein RRG08_027475 [Elysia crispata]
MERRLSTNCSRTPRAGPHLSAPLKGGNALLTDRFLTGTGNRVLPDVDCKMDNCLLHVDKTVGMKTVCAVLEGFTM